MTKCIDLAAKVGRNSVLHIYQDIFNLVNISVQNLSQDCQGEQNTASEPKSTQIFNYIFGLHTRSSSSLHEFFAIISIICINNRF
jgi:hypothetical protein